MNRVLLLTKVFLANIGSNNKTASKTKQYLLAVIGILCGGIPIAGLIFMMSQGLFKMFVPLNQASFVYVLIINMAMTLTFFVSFFTIPPLFYFGNDIETILPLPFRAWEIVSAKFLSALVWEYGVTGIVFLPMCMGYLMTTPLSTSFLIAGIIGILTLPIVPLIYASVIVMILMRFTRFFSNKERFNLIAGLLTLLFAVGINVFLQQFTMNLDVAKLQQLITTPDGMMGLIKNIFPHIAWLSKVAIHEQYLYILPYMGFLIGSIGIFIFVSKQFYFEGVLNISGTQAKKVKLTNKQIQSQSKRSSIVWAFAKKDIYDLLRSSVYLLNNVLISVMFPLIIGMTLIFGESSGDTEVQQLTTLLKMSQGDLMNVGIIIGISLAFLTSGMNCVSLTAISREGQNYIFMKMVPVSDKEFVHAKLIPGIILGMIAYAGCTIAMAIVLALSLSMIIVMLVFGIIAILVINLGNFIIGAYYPKLDWTTEAQVAKQSMLAFVGIFLNIGLAGLVWLLLLFKNTSNFAFASIVGLSLLILLIILYRLSIKAMHHFLDTH